MSGSIRDDAVRRGITRLCHFTPVKNLLHILSDESGLKSTGDLLRHEGGPFTPTDPHRYDGYEGYICCTIEYPNLWYLDKAQERDPVFPDWAVLFIAADALWGPQTLLCPHNAARHGGAAVSSGFEAFS
jgi:hypothetical protein